MKEYFGAAEKADVFGDVEYVHLPLGNGESAGLDEASCVGVSVTDRAARRRFGDMFRWRGGLVTLGVSHPRRWLRPVSIAVFGYQASKRRAREMFEM